MFLCMVVSQILHMNLAACRRAVFVLWQCSRLKFCLSSPLLFAYSFCFLNFPSARWLFKDVACIAWKPRMGCVVGTLAWDVRCTSSNILSASRRRNVASAVDSVVVDLFIHDA